MIEYPGVTFAFAVFGWLGFMSQFSYKNVAPILCYAFAYTGIQAIWFLTHPLSQKPAQQLLGENLSLQALFALAIGVVFINWPRRAVWIVGALLHLLTLVSAAALAIFPSSIPDHWWTAGLILNPALNASMAAVTFPFVSRFYKNDNVIFFFLVTTIIMVVASRSLTPCLTFAACCAANHFVAYRWRNERDHAWVWRAIKASAFVMALGILFDAPGDNQRLHWWKFFFLEWKENFSWVFGAGANQFMLVGPLLQMDQVTTERWAHLHSDVFQVMFELGLIGTLLWCLVVRKALLVSKDRLPEFFAAQVAFLVPLAIYFPLHSSLGSVVAALLLWPLYSPARDPSSRY